MKTIPSSGKINLTLRITGKLPSGYHELTSVFLRISALESLTINRSMTDNVRVKFRYSSDIIQGQNILLKTLDVVRRQSSDVPFLDMLLEKRVPPGTGLGCGSGNAAALLEWLQLQGYCVEGCAAQIGADVPFFCRRAQAALASGIGDILEDLDMTGCSLRGAVVIPAWRCLTAPYFAALDAHFGQIWPVGHSEAKEEALRIARDLKNGTPLGLLPNDFCSVLMKEHGEYSVLFDAFKALGASAWGISGSGSSAFALWNKDRFPESLKGKLLLPWIQDILEFYVQDRENR